MTTKTTVATTLLALAALVPGEVSAHEVSGYVSASGIEFIEAQIPSYVPSQLTPPPLSKELACITATQRDTTVNLEVLDLDLAMPGSNQLRVDITLAGSANGVLDIDGPYACLGRAVCTDELTIDSARAIMDFEIRIENGQPMIELAALDLQLSEDDIDGQLSDCAIDGLVNNTVLGFAKGWVLGYLEDKAEEMATTSVGPMLEDVLKGFLKHDLKFGAADFSVAVNDLMIAPDALQLGVDIDAHSQISAADCVESDPGEPTSVEGTASFTSGMNAHLGLAVNFGLVNDILYHVWRRGLTCLTGDHLEALGLHLDYDHISALLPGFPSGTEIGLNLKLEAPPVITGLPSSDAKIAVELNGVEVEIVALLPDGTERVLGMSMDAKASGAVAIDPSTSALVARLDGAEMTRMDLDELAAAQLGFDTAQIITMMNTQIVPSMLAKMGDLPVTGSMFNFADYAIILRGLDTSSGAFLQAEVDLFRAPANDNNAPDTTIVGSPSGIVSPAYAKIRVGGTDVEIPSELLRYKVVVDDEVRPTTPMTEFKIGEFGVTKTYLVKVSAVDLNDNEDASPATMELTVDGISPTVLIDGPRSKLHEGGGEVALAWTASDDLTSPERLLTSIKVYRLKDPTDPTTAELKDEYQLDANTTNYTVDVASGSVYRVEVNVTDEAGNTATSAVLLDGSGGCGCSTAASPGGAAPIVLAFLLAGLIMRRRRREDELA